MLLTTSSTLRDLKLLEHIVSGWEIAKIPKKQKKTYPKRICLLFETYQFNLVFLFSYKNANTSPDTSQKIVLSCGINIKLLDKF